jgi:hypothetical protein
VAAMCGMELPLAVCTVVPATLTYARAQVSGTVMLYPPSRLYCFIWGLARRVMVMAACAGGGAAAGRAAAARPATPASSHNLRPAYGLVGEGQWHWSRGEEAHVLGTGVQGQAAAGVPPLLLLQLLVVADTPGRYAVLRGMQRPAA